MDSSLAFINPLGRREFLRGSALLAAGAWASRELGAAPAAAGALRIVFATDFHLMLNDALGSAAGVAQCLKAIEALQPRPEFILCGGDLTHELPMLSLDSAEKLFDRCLALWKENTSLPTRWVLGNHDLAATRFGGAPRLDPRFGEGLFRQRLGLESTRYSFDAGSWHFVVLDDVVFDAAGGYVGEFSEEQLAFLRTDLVAVPPGRPVAISCHIPALSVLPVMAGMAKSFGANIQTPAASLVARSPKPLLDAIGQSGAAVKLVLSGHLHHLEQVEVDGIRFLNGGAVCGNWWKGPQAGCPEGFTVLDLQPNGAIEAKYQAYGWKP